MIVTLIEKVYRFSVGRSGADSTAGRQHSGDFASDYFTDSYRNLFYGSDAFSADSPVPGYGAGTG